MISTIDLLDLLEGRLGLEEYKKNPKGEVKTQEEKAIFSSFSGLVDWSIEEKECSRIWGHI